jgi:hypothetical protein
LTQVTDRRVVVDGLRTTDIVDMVFSFTRTGVAIDRQSECLAIAEIFAKVPRDCGGVQIGTALRKVNCITRLKSDVDSNVAVI